MSKDYDKIAKTVGMTFRVGKYGVRLFQRNSAHKIFSVDNLNDFIIDPQEIAQAIADDPSFSVGKKK